MKAAVLGSPVAHSLSPALHRAAYAALGLDLWHYTAIECDEAGLPGFLATLDNSWAGLSLTMPLKRAVLPLLDEVDPLAADVGGANTVVFAGQRRRGYNTDVGGMVDALAEAGITSAGSALVIGAGATACSALAALSDLGVTKAAVAVRDLGRTTELRAAALRLGVAIELLELGESGADAVLAAGAGGLVVCTIPPGGADQIARSLREARRPPRVVFDVAYGPQRTRLAMAASAAGAVVVEGFGLLLHQAARQVELMTGLAAPLPAMRAAGLAEMSARQAAGPLRRMI
jgi:shikimate dehydrogenase